MNAQNEYCRIAMIQNRSERAVEVLTLEKTLEFNLWDRAEFNKIAIDGNLHVPQIQEF
jgi:hypothetical protein